MSLYRMIYCSQAIPNLNFSELKDIMHRSKKNNTALGLTGMLCYGNSTFLQAIEGNRKFITQTYNRIIMDSRHFNPEIIEFIEVEERLFNEWSMKLIQMGADYEDEANKAVLKYSNTHKFAPIFMNGNQCIKLLVELNNLYKEKI